MRQDAVNRNWKHRVADVAQCSPSLIDRVYDWDWLFGLLLLFQISPEAVIALDQDWASKPLSS